MADKSNIEWTDATWNPIVGCSIVSPGCTNCYAMSMAHRINKMTLSSHYEGTTKKVNGNVVWTGKVALANDHILRAPLRWKRGRRIFVNSMGDLFHESIPDEWIDNVFAVMALAPQHTFQVLTKRAERMRVWFADPDRADNVGLAILARAGTLPHGHRRVPWPLPNVWLGISAERQEEWDARKEHLRNTPAAVRFASFEPLLGAIVEPHNLSHYIQWAIVGGESGSNARPMHPDWVRHLREQCRAWDVPFFFKQRGEYTWVDEGDYDSDRIPDLPRNWRERTDDKYICMRADGSRADGYGGDGAEFLYRVGKKVAGRLLDGIEHSAFPMMDWATV